jgi:hypothetical protein
MHPDMAVAGEIDRSQEINSGAPGQGTVPELFRRAGAEALVGCELFLKEGRIGARRRVQVERLNPDGQSYEVIDLRAKAGLVKDFSPAEMSAGLGTENEDDAVVKLMKQHGPETLPRSSSDETSVCGGRIQNSVLNTRSI